MRGTVLKLEDVSPQSLVFAEGLRQLVGNELLGFDLLLYLLRLGGRRKGGSKGRGVLRLCNELVEAVFNLGQVGVEFVLLLQLPNPLLVVGLGLGQLFLELVDAAGLSRIGRALFVNFAHAFLLLAQRAHPTFKVLVLFLDFGLERLDAGLQSLFSLGVFGAQVASGLDHHGDRVGVLVFEGLFEQAALLLQVLLARALLFAFLQLCRQFSTVRFERLDLLLLVCEQPLIFAEPRHFGGQVADLAFELFAFQQETFSELLGGVNFVLHCEF